MAADGTELMGADPLEEAGQALKVRAFFGLPAPEALSNQLERYLATCAATAPGFRWVPAANLHLTIRFIGTVERDVVEKIADRLAQRGFIGFELGLGGVGTFRRGHLVRVVWLQVSWGVEAARELAAQVEAECATAGLAASADMSAVVKERRPFQPHLTLARARARDGAPLPPIPEPPQLEPWRADELVLYRSHLSRAGSVYEPLRTIRLS